MRINSPVRWSRDELSLPARGGQHRDSRSCRLCGFNSMNDCLLSAMAGEQKLHGLVQQFIIMAQRAEGLQLLSTISQLLEAPGVFVFGEFVKLDCIQELADGPDDAYFKLLNVFAYGTYLEYEDQLPPLSEMQKYKLRQLTLITIAEQMQHIPYSVLLWDLGLHSQRQLEDLIIKSFYAQIICGKLDQHRKVLEVDAFISRDINSQVLNRIISDLQEWCNGCNCVSAEINWQLSRLDQSRKHHLSTQQQLKAEVSNIKTLLTSPSISSLKVEQGREQQGVRHSHHHQLALMSYSGKVQPAPWH
ncbi:COP9 signalosome complex subunit 7b-like [Arapaima gigas]